MTEQPSHNPDVGSDLLKNQERPLLKAASDLVRAVATIAPNPDCAPQPPQALIVGGYVRDVHLGLHPKDADIEVYGVAADQLKELLERLFGTTKDVGEAFGIIKVPIGDKLELDVSIPRRESKAGKGHTGFLIDSDPSLNIKEAARRRDFTVNALAMDPITGVVFDPFGGLEDLQTKTLRITDPERFQDDPLRVLRAMQFIARIEFTVDPESERLMHEMVERGDLTELSRERITEEFEKLIFKGKRPSIGLAFARRIGVIEASFPNATVKDWDVWEHLMDRAVAHKKERHATLAAFLSGFSLESREAAVTELTFKKKDIECAQSLLCASEIQDSASTNPINDARRTLKRVLPASPEAYAAWLRILERGEEADRFLSLVQEHHLSAQALLQGRDLIELFQLKPGPKFREIIDAVEAARDRAQIETREQAIAYVKTLL
ncbi:MAG: hypothetical protein WC654_00425 [Patescibacteria group bacterium]